MPRTRSRLAWLLFCLMLAGALHAFAQGTLLTVGPLNVTAPPGWSAQTNTVPVRIFSPDSTPQQYFSVEFFPPQSASPDLPGQHGQVWGKLAAALQITAPLQSGMTGQFVWTRSDVPRRFGQKETFILYSTSYRGVYVGVAVRATHANLVARNLPAIETMLRQAVLLDLSSGSSPASAAPASGNGNASAAPPAAGNIGTLDEYVYTAPSGWATQRLTDAIMLSSPLSATNEKCLIYMFPMRPAGANLLDDAQNVFRDVWRGYVPNSRTPAGFAMPESIVRGSSGQGWDYVIVRRGISPPNSPESRLGFVMVAKLDNRLAVVSGLSRDPLVSACMGENTGATTWPKFFYSLSFRNWKAPDQTQAMRRRLAGVWTAATASASDQITFAGNGRFANAAAAQQYHLSSTELFTTTQAYFGNGSYTLRGNAITLTQDDKRIEHGFFRVEQESRDEGRTWADFLYLLRTSAVDGSEYELRYGKAR